MTEPQTTETLTTSTPEVLPPEPTTKELMALSPEDRLSIERRDAGSYVFDPAAFALAQNIAKSLALSALLPDHLRKDKDKRDLPLNVVIANCLFLVADAGRWRMSPHALMPESYPRPGGGGLSYQGKVIAGIINKFLNIRLNYRWEGAGPERSCTAFATVPGETEPRTATVVFKNAVTKDKDGRPKPAWVNDPDQKLSYGAAIKWGRLHSPELVTGVITADEADAMAEERRATLPATPSPSETPQVLQDFAAGKLDRTVPPESGRTSEGVTNSPPPPAPAAPGLSSGAQKPPQADGSAFLHMAASKQAVKELVTLGKDAGLTQAEVNELAREVCEGRQLAQLRQSDVLVMVEQIGKIAQDRQGRP